MASEGRRSGVSRRQFMRWLAALGVGTTLVSCGGEEGPAPTDVSTPTRSAMRERTREATLEAAKEAGEPTHTPEPAADPMQEPTLEPTPGSAAPGTYLAVTRGEDARAITVAAVAALGGMERFVKSGHDVIVKPNICVDYRAPEYGATTNPAVVAALVEMCLGAGAKRVRVMDAPFAGSPQSAYAKSGIAQAVESAGGVMEVMNSRKFLKTEIPEGRDITTWKVYQDVLAADVVIDVPIAKHHGQARLSLGCKNLMGVIMNPGQMHINLGQRIADLTSLVRPALTVVDAVRTLMNHGPTGGNLDDVILRNTVIASHDIVAADAYAATFFGLTGNDIAYVRAAAEMGLGTLDLGSIRIEEIGV